MRRVRIAVDAVIAGLFVAVMATALVQETPHEYLGTILFVAVAAHVTLNRRWFKALARGRYNAVRMLRLVMVVGLLACIVGQVASALVLSKYVFGFLPVLPGASLARRVHMLCSYWGFTFAFAHVGLNFKGLLRLMHIEGTSDTSGAHRHVIWTGRFLFAIIACFGAYSFVRLGFGAYLLGQVQFAVAGYGMSIIPSLMDYASIAVLIAGLFHYLRTALESFEKDRRQQKPQYERDGDWRLSGGIKDSVPDSIDVGGENRVPVFPIFTNSLLCEIVGSIAGGDPIGLERGAHEFG